MRKTQVLILMVFMTLLTAGISVSVTTATVPNQASEVVFKTPEEAITSYMEGVAQADLSKIFQACAINEMSENFKFDLYIERLRAFTPQAQAPTNHPFFVELNKVQLSSQLANQVKFLTYSLLSSEPVSDGNVILMDVEKANSFMKEIDPQRLAQLKVERIELPDKTLMTSDKYLENANKIARVYGADESTERVVLISFEENHYYLGFTLLRYGENWKISAQMSPVANTSAIGAAQKTTVDEFESMINGK